MSEASKVIPHTNPNVRRLGRSENTVTPSPNASTKVVRMIAGPTRTRALRIASSGRGSCCSSRRKRLKK